MAGEDDDKGGETTFTRAQMAREVNRQVKEKVAAALSEYGDLEELKRKADEADSQKTKLDKMAEQLEALTKRAETAEIDVARARVAEELGLTPKEAKRLSGKTYAELKADGDELVDDLGIDVKARKSGGKPKGRTSDGKGSDADDDAGSEEGDDEADEAGDDDKSSTRETEQRPAPRRRPRELRSGSSMPNTRDRDETDPLKLIEGVPRGR